MHRDLHTAPKRAIGAEGHYIVLSDGQRLLDSTGGAAVSCLGHANERVKEAIRQQLEQVPYCHSMFFATGVFEELAAVMRESTGGEMERLFAVSSGNNMMSPFGTVHQYSVSSISRIHADGA